MNLFDLYGYQQIQSKYECLYITNKIRYYLLPKNNT